MRLHEAPPVRGLVPTLSPADDEAGGRAREEDEAWTL